MRKKWGRFFRTMGLPFWTFVGIGFSTFVFTYAGNLVRQLLIDALAYNKPDERWTGSNYFPDLLILAITTVGAFFLFVYLSSPRRGSVDKFQRPEGKEGLIILVSNPASAKHAVNYHFTEMRKLRYVWLIPSNDEASKQFGKGTLSVAEALQTSLSALELEGRKLTVTSVNGVSAADAQDTYEKVNHIFRENREIDIIGDFTGGTKPMTVGMVMACLPADRELEYVPYNPETKTSSGPFLIDYQHSAFGLVG